LGTELLEEIEIDFFSLVIIDYFPVIALSIIMLRTFSNIFILIIIHFISIINGKSTATLVLSNLPLSSPFSAGSPKYYGVNLGHKSSDDSSWVKFLKYFGVGRVRFFGVGGAANKLSLPAGGLGASVSKVTNSYGSSLSGFMVSNLLENWLLQFFFIHSNILILLLIGEFVFIV